MKTIVIAYGSTTGNTESVAQLIAGHLSAFNTTVVDISALQIEQVTAADCVLLGSSTWGYGELQDDFATYLPQITAQVYGGKQVAVFGCGDQAAFSEVFCEAVTQIEAQLQKSGAVLAVEGLRVDGDVSDNLEAIEAFSKAIAGL